MKSTARLGAAIVLSLVLAVGAPVAASANDGPTVDFAEFDAAKIGHTSVQVQRNFDSPGAVVYRSNDILLKKYRHAYGDRYGDVSAAFQRQGSVWRLSAKSAFWAVPVNRAHNPATKAEYLQIKAGMTIPQVRAIIGSNGSRVIDVAGGAEALREYDWPASTSSTGQVMVLFELKGGTYVVIKKIAFW